MEEQAAIIAYHYARSAHQDRATRYALVAGDRAVRLHARAEATSYYDQAFKMAWALPDSPEAQRWQIDATLKLATVGVTRQDLDRDLASLERARALAETWMTSPVWRRCSTGWADPLRGRQHGHRCRLCRAESRHRRPPRR